MKKRIVILGAGESGVGAALLAKTKGFDVFVSDNGTISKPYKEDLIINSIAFEEGKHTEDLILNADQVIKSPGIPDDSPIVIKLLRDRISVISEIEFASFFTNARFIAVTGSNGKTTTTLLIHYLCKQAGLNVCLAGNIGKSLCRQVNAENIPNPKSQIPNSKIETTNFIRSVKFIISVIRVISGFKIQQPASGTRHPDWYIVELSSFQLDGIYNFKPHIAILLNITPDHLDRYDNDFQKYINSKFRITKNMTEKDYFIYWAEDDVISREIQKTSFRPFKLPVSLKEKIKNGAYFTSDYIIINRINKVLLSEAEVSSNHQSSAERSRSIIKSSNIPLPGKHNTINTMAAILASTLAGVNHSIFNSSLKNFKSPPHRLELVSTINGIKFINDSKATNVDSVWYALDTFKEKIVWIAGGIDKGNNYEILNDLVKEKVKAIVCLGNDNSKIHAAFNEHIKQIVDTTNMEDAVKKAFKIAKCSDTILLSPACASFDIFENYEDRGEQFKLQIQNLAK